MRVGFSAMATENIDSRQLIDVALLDAKVAVAYGTGSIEEMTAAEQIFRDLHNNPEMWRQVKHILHYTKNLNTKFFTLQVLEGVIKYQWNALPVKQRAEMKSSICYAIQQISSNEASFRKERLHVNKLNVILVQIWKHESQQVLQSDIANLVEAAKTSETMCENCMAILKLLSEEVFNFSRPMTQQITDLKQSLNREFELILVLCLDALFLSQRNELICATLSTLHAFLPWIPFHCIFLSTLLDTLLKFFPVPAYRNLALQCLTEVAALNLGDVYNVQYIKMYNSFMAQLQVILPPTTDLFVAYPLSSTEDQAFIQNLALFFTSFYKFHIQVLETTQENIAALVMGLRYLKNISYVEDTKVSKVCSDYRNSLVRSNLILTILQ